MKTTATTEPVRAPKQERSQRSFDLVLEASTQLLIEEGYEGFSIKRVSSRSGVSTGSIYARVDSKDDLVHIIAARLYEQREKDHQEMMERAKEISRLAELVALVIPELAEILHRHAPLMRPILLRAPYDEQLLGFVRANAITVPDDVVELFNAHRDEITHPHPDRAARLAFMLAGNTIFSYLGLGTMLVAPEMGDWDELLEDLADAVCRVLGVQPAVT